jgi:hypothetical protein
MKRALRYAAFSAVAMVGGLTLPAAEAPPWEEVLGIVRSNLAGVTEIELNAAAVRGLLQQFPSRVILESPTAAAPASPPEASPLVARTNVFEGAYAYARIEAVRPGLANALEAALAGLRATNDLKGLALDLRFAGGTEFPEAGRTADLFVSRELPLLHWGEGSVKSTAKTNAFTLPLAILVNSETRGAAEVLAAVLRATRSAVIIGAPTAGEVSVFRSFPLSNGERLRVAAAPVTVADEGQPLSGGQVPDILVSLSAAEEREHLADPFKPPTGARRNAGNIPRLTEADLVRIHREGLDPMLVRPRRPARTSGPAVTDPALVRALDLLKGLAVFEARPAP